MPPPRKSRGTPNSQTKNFIPRHNIVKRLKIEYFRSSEKRTKEILYKRNNKNDSQPFIKKEWRLRDNSPVPLTH